MSEAEIQAVIFEVLHRIAPEADPAQLAPNANLREALDIDSFDFLNFLIGLHDRLKIEIPEVDYGKLTSIAALVSYLHERMRPDHRGTK